MNDTKKEPHSLTADEWDEIAGVSAIRDSWGLAPEDRGEALKLMAYGVRFDFESGGPGYSGDLYVVQGDSFGGAPLVLCRQGGTLSLVAFD